MNRYLMCQIKYTRKKTGNREDGRCTISQILREGLSEEVVTGALKVLQGRKVYRDLRKDYLSFRKSKFDVLN